MATLKSKRGPIRAAFTRTLNELKSELNKPEGNLELVLRLKKQLEDRFLSLEKVDEQIDIKMQEDDQTTEEDFSAEYNSVIEYRDKYSDIMFTVNNLERKNMEQINFDRESSDGSSYHTNVSCEMRSKYKLPKLELRKFNGDPKDWLSFWSQFQGIHEDKSISAEIKFQYLIQSTVEKSLARELVTSFPPTAVNYFKAIECMKARFGKETLLIEVYVRELLNLVLSNAVHGQGNSVTALYDKLETQLHGLESLGVTRDKYAAMLYPLVESAIPEEVLKTWQRTRYQTTANQQENVAVDDQLSSLMKFLRSEVDSEIRLKLAKTGIGNDDAMISNDSVLQCSERKIICFFCKNPGHNKQNCRKYKQWLKKQSNDKNSNAKKEPQEQNSANESNKDAPAQSLIDRKISTEKVNKFNEREDLHYDREKHFLFSIGEVEPDNWNLDSAATSHVCNDRAVFDTLDESIQGSVKLPNGENIEVMGVGTGTISLSDGNGNTNTAKIKDLLYAPSAVGNFLSVSRLTKSNYRVKFDRSTAEIKYKNVRIGIADMKGGMYCLRQAHKY